MMAGKFIDMTASTRQTSVFIGQVRRRQNGFEGPLISNLIMGNKHDHRTRSPLLANRPRSSNKPEATGERGPDLLSVLWI